MTTEQFLNRRAREIFDFLKARFGKGWRVKAQTFLKQVKHSSARPGFKVNRLLLFERACLSLGATFERNSDKPDWNQALEYLTRPLEIGEIIDDPPVNQNRKKVVCRTEKIQPPPPPPVPPLPVKKLALEMNDLPLCPRCRAKDTKSSVRKSRPKKRRYARLRLSFKRPATPSPATPPGAKPGPIPSLSPSSAE